MRVQGMKVSRLSDYAMNKVGKNKINFYIQKITHSSCNPESDVGL